MLTDGLPAVEAACTEAIAQGVHSADVVLNILAPGPSPGRAFLETDTARIGVDCGMFQGPKSERELNYRPFPFDPRRCRPSYSRPGTSP